ncbi:hypothetical protein AB0L41_46870 [Amycolatopsis mediterranei]|uniref:hypothetical protein n=1 Tax=Amycolatopsis mediterranei TaxID=33910 RepID=UPI003443F866
MLRDQAFGHPEPEKIAHGDPADHPEDHPVDAQGRVVRAFAFLNPPDHIRLRRLVSKAFTPRMVEQLTPRIEALVGELIGQALEKGETDLMSAPLARIEGSTVLRELARRATNLALAGDPEWSTTVTLRGLRSLLVTVA